MKLKLLLTALLTTLSLHAVTVGEKPTPVTIEGDNGGLIDGSPWSSNTIKDSVIVMFYVDPDEKSVNEEFSKALKEKKYREKGDFSSIAVVNLAATWKPNIVIEKLLASKQKEFPQTTYVKDKASILVKEWNLKDDASNVLIFDKKGKLLFYKSGKLDKSDREKAFSIIEANL
jgi:hypothetical protein